MILCYHKVDLRPESHWWVTADAFDRQMADLQAYDVVTLDAYDPEDPDAAVITFDGVYANVAHFAAPVLEKWGYPFELFVIGDHLGRDNDFDQHVEPPARFAGLEELERLVEAGGRVQWHTRSHGPLAELDDERLAHELTPPPELTERFGDGHLGWFAYPHGAVDDRVAAAVRERFAGAVSVVQGTPGDRYRLARFEVDEQRSLSRSSVAVVVPNYNYGRFLPEAIDSVVRQTGRVDELLVIDDCSTDGSQEVMRRYADVARLEFNERNLGIVENFRKAVSLTTSDYVVFLGADNRMRSDFVERAKAALDRHPDASVAYTDVAIFGPRSEELARSVGAEPTAAADVFVWRFPDPTPERMARLREDNFVHGSSMYRRTAYEAAGGYRSSDGAEDHDLFTRMLLREGATAVRVPEPVLEYRQHSPEQANTRLAAQLEAAHHQRRADELENRVRNLTDEVRAAEAREADVRAVVAGLERQRELDLARVAELEAEAGDLRARAADSPEELDWLRGRARTLSAIEAGGWWRLRGRVMRVVERVRPG